MMGAKGLRGNIIGPHGMEAVASLGGVGMALGMALGMVGTDEPHNCITKRGISRYYILAARFDNPQ